MLCLHYIGLFSGREMVPRLLSRYHINCPLKADRSICQMDTVSTRNGRLGDKRGVWDGVSSRSRSR
jgi:hypothetical protein